VYDSALAVLNIQNKYPHIDNFILYCISGQVRFVAFSMAEVRNLHFQEESLLVLIL
jgi:hypothetical protein